MDNLITVVSLQGQAWAVALDGSRRELQVGDTISANEMVVTAEGAQIDLQFANNQILSLIGEQEASAQALQAAQALPLSAPLTAINTPQTTSVPANLSENVAKEGHNFVPLVHIAEIIEADGFTPLTVARIQEIIKPLGMVLPERDFEQDRWKEHVSYREHGSNDGVTVNVPTDHTVPVGSDGKPTNPADYAKTNDHVVFESGLTGGSKPDVDATKVVSSFTLKALDGLDPTNAFSIKYKDISGVEQTFMLGKDAIEALGTTAQTITTQYGELKLNGYRQAPDGTITINYDYLLNTEPTVTGDAINDDFVITVKDKDVDTAVGTISIKIVDDATVAVDDANSITEDATTLATGNVFGATGASANDKQDTQGADGATITGVQSGTVTAGSHVADSNLPTDITGKYGTLTLNADGTYSYKLDNTNLTVQGLGAGATLDDEVFSYTITDKDGDKSTATLTITINGSNDGVTVNVPTDHTVPVDSDGKPTNYTKTNDHVVFESGLVGGSSPDADATKVVSSFTLKALDGLDPTNAFSIKYKDISGVEQTFMLGKDAIEALGTTAQTITTQYGELKLNGYSQAPDGTITINYDYLLNTAPTVTGDAINDDFVITVKDKDIDTAVGTISIKIVDDAPVAVDDANSITEDATTPATGNVFGATDASADDKQDTQGADGATVTGVQAGTVTAGSHVADSNLPTDITGKYGTLTLNADGTYSYNLDNTNLTVQSLGAGATLDDEVFSYTITDKDGDKSTATLTITINGSNDGVTVDVPTDHNVPVGLDGKPADPADYTKTDDHVVFESGLAGGSSPDAEATKVVSSFTLKALDGLAADDAVTITYSGGGLTLSKAQVEALGTTPQTISTPYGDLVLDGYSQDTDPSSATFGTITIDYNYTLNTAPTVPGDATNDVFGIVVKDKDTDQDAGTISIKIMDDAPVAVDDANSITEDAITPATGNVFGATDASADDKQDTQGADGATVTGVQAGAVTAGSHVADGNLATQITGKYGTLTLNADGTYSYELDNTNLTVQGLGQGETLEDEVFSYTITDKDGDKSTATLTITINGSNDGVTVNVPTDHTVPVDSDGKPTNYTKTNDHVVFESGLTGGSKPNADATKVVSNFTLTALDGLDPTNAFSINYKDINGDEQTFMLGKDAIEALGATAQTITTQYGELKLNGYSQAPDGTITINYDYLLNTAPTVTGDAINDDFVITVKDKDVDTAVGTISIKIVDDAPVAVDDANSITEDATTLATGNVFGATDASANDKQDTQGADGATITGVQSGTVTAGSHVADSNLPTDITGKYGTLTLNADGTYSYKLDNTNLTVQSLGAGATLDDEVFSYTITDKDGDQSTASLTITINGQNDDVTVVIPQPPKTEDVVDPNDPTKPGANVALSDQVVFESGLANGSNPDADATKVVSSFTLKALDGLDPTNAFSIKYKDISGVEQTFMLGKDAIEALGTTAQTITTQYGELKLNGYSQAPDGTITINYDYLLNTAPTVTGDAINDDFVITVKDKDVDTAVGTISIKVVDDAPVAVDDANSITEDATTPATGNVFGSKNASVGDAEDTQGADGAIVTGVQAGAVAADTHVVDGNLATAIPGKYGTLTLNADGTYSYELDSANLVIQGLGPDQTLEDEVFSYTITDSDGDQSTATLTITINGSNDGVTVDVPIDHDVPVDSDGKPTNYTKTDDHVVFESGLVGGSSPDADATKVVSSFTLKALDGLDPTNAFSIKYKDISGVEQTFMLGKDAIEALGTTAQTITTQYGELKLNGYSQAPDGTITINYDYLLNTAPTVTGDAINDDFVITVKDKDIDTAVGTISIKIVDDAPVAVDDANSITEDATTPATGNVFGATDASADDKQDTQGADGATVTGVQAGAVTAGSHVADGNLATQITGKYGTLTLNADGTYSYELDNTNLTVQGLGQGETLEDEVFSYTITDKDGDKSTATLTITINGSNDGVTNVPTDHTVPLGPDGKPTNPADYAKTDDQVVFESGLTGGSNPDADATKVVSYFTLTALDGLDPTNALSIKYKDNNGDEQTFMLGKDAIEALGTTSQTITTQYGELNLNGYSQAPDGTITINYDYLLNTAPTVTGDAINDDFVITVKDKDVDTAVGTISIKIIDDTPTAVDDKNTVDSGSYAAVTGNVIGGTDASTNDEADVVGADGAKVTVVKFTDPDTNNETEITLPTNGTSTTIDGTYGVLTIQSDGSYSYQRSAGKPGGVSDEFTYTLTDGDNDTDSATLTITIANAGVSVGGLTDDTASSDAVVHESAFTNAGGRDAGTGVDAGSITASQNFTISSPDGIAELSITHGSSTYNLVLNNLTQTLPRITTTLGNKLEITGYNASTGVVNYTYTLVDNESHGSAGRDDLFENFTVNLKDMDNGTTTGDLAVRIVDDIPVITQATAQTVAVEVDESVLSTDASADFSVLFGVDHGADGAATSNATVYTLDVNAVSGLVDTASGENVVLSVNGAGTLVTGTAGGNTVFTITIDSATGEITLDQLRAVKHSDITKHNDAVSIIQGAVSITATATDGDGDKVTSTIAIGDRFTFLDDGPSIAVGVDTGAVTVLTDLVTKDAETLTGASTTNANFAGAFIVASSDYRADGDGGTLWAYTLDLKGEVASLASGLRTGGDAINLYVVGSQIVGSTAATSAGITAGNTAFTVTVDGTGQVALTQQLPIDHSNTNSSNETIALVNDLITLTGTATITDDDGDTASSSQIINIGDKFVFTDDGPTVGTPVDSTVNEANLAAGSAANNAALTQTGSLNIGLSADGVDTQFTRTTLANFTALGLTSGGTAISYALSADGHTLAASAGVNTVFTATITNPSAADAGYKFVLSALLDHLKSANDTELDLPFNFIVTDKDGDTATGSFKVTVTDDAPVAANDTNTVAKASYTAVTGNVISTGAGADTQGADGATVTQVSFGTTDVTVPTDNTSTTINGSYGVLTIQADGSYSYQRTAGTPGGVNDEFTYTLTDGDGDTASATLTVEITDAPVSITDLTPQASGGDVTVLESKLTGGTGVDTGAATATGSFTISSPDGVAELFITHDGSTYNLVLSNVTQTLPTITTALGNTLEITGYDAGTGVVSYTYTLLANETHSAQGQDDLFENFTVNLEDMGGDSTTSDLAVRIVDDIPVITQTGAALPTLTVDESDFNTNATADFSGLFTINHGADGEAASNATVYTLSTNGSSGLVDTASGVLVELTVSGSVITGTAGTNTVFTITIDSATGEITLDQLRAVKHSDIRGHNDAVSIIKSAVSITATATDGDNDTVTSTIEIGDGFTFLDDGPSITAGTDTTALPSELVTNDAETIGSSTSTANANFADAFIVARSDYGADGNGGTVWNYALGFTNASSGLTSAGEAITLAQSGDTITGTANGNTVFTIAVNPSTGEVTLTQYAAIDHGTAENNSADFSTDTQTLAADIVTLTGTATITDGDGDTASSSQIINIGDKFVFTDDGPTVGTPVDSRVNEANLAAGSAANNAALTQTGSLNIGLSADGVDTQFISSTVADFVILDLTSGGMALTYVLSADGHTLTATAGVNTVFTATITNPTAADAGYKFVLSAPLDHVKSANDTELDLPFNFIVTDKDGDTATGSFKVTVTDDMPFAENDSNTVAKASYTAVTGNVISTGAGAGADTQGADGATVTQVSFGATDVTPPSNNSSITINGTYGVLTIQADGSYSYQRTAGTAGGVNDEFAYTLTDGDGDTANATLTVNITDAGVSITDLTPQANGGDATVLESKLTGGTGVDTGAATASGTFTISSPDGIAELSITHNGTTTNLVLSNTTQSLPTITTALGNTLAITGYNAGTGVVSYTYTLRANETHSAQGQDNLFENFTVNLEDMDGDSTTSDLAVRIVDDIPVITQTGTALPTLTVDESDFNTNATANFSGLFGVNHGADGHAALTYTLDAGAANGTGPSDSGRIDTLTGNRVWLYKEGDDIVARVGNSNSTNASTANPSGAEAFKISIDTSTGDVTLDQSRSLVHSDTSSHDETTSLITGSVRVTATATDGDGDVVTSTISIGNRFVFKDDGPSITVDAAQVGTIELDESNLAGASQSITVASFADGVFTTNFGADGAASTAGFVYSLAVSNNAVYSGLKDTASGEDILLRVNGSGDVEGYVAAGKVVVFTVSVNGATGALTLEQFRALSHSNTNNHDDVVNILNGTIQLVGTATDGDGDTAIQSINIGEKITFRDDGPSITAVTTETTVDEKGLPAGSDPGANLLSASASLNVDFGTDGAGDVQFTIGTTAHLKTLSLKAGGTDLEFVIDNNNHSLTAYRGTGREAGDKVFTVDITDPKGVPGYSFVLHAPIDHAGAADLTLAFKGIQVTDGDGDSVIKDFDVKVIDDAPATTIARTIDEDSDGTSFNTSADANPTNTTIYNQADNALTGTSNSNGGVDYKTDYGTVTVNADGTITYKPDANYSGEDVFIFKTQDGDSTEDTTVTMTVTPVADAPELEADKPLIANEDVSIAFGLQMPVITDKTDQNGTAAGDDPERLGEITLTLTGDAIGTLTKGDDSALIGSGGVYKFVITDVADLHLGGLTSADDSTVNYVTQAEYEAIKALPAADRHENFDVEVSVKSYEVDASGAALPDAQVGAGNGGINGAESTQTITVDVRAVTDAVGLKVQEDVTQTDVSVVISGGDKIADVTLNEDNSFNLTSILNPDAFVDTDGSETRYLGIHGLPDGTTIEVDGTPFIIGSSPITTFDFGDGNGAVPAIEFVGTQTTLPVITITPPADFSGDINGLTVTLAAIDSDSDSTATALVLETDAVTINLHVQPAAGDVEAGNVTTQEDTAVDFMKLIKVTDTSTGSTDGGKEIITQVAFTLPTDWKLTDKPAVSSDWEITGDDATGYVIKGLNGYDLQNVLKDFTVTPLAHSSADKTIKVTVTTADTNTVDGTSVTSTANTDLDIKVTVTPVAEVVGGNTGGNSADLTMMGDRDYTTAGEEDEWFDLGTDDGKFNFSDGWANEDSGSEKTYALLTPELVVGAGSQVTAIGSTFRYKDENDQWVEETYVGDPIEVPMEFLDSLEFKAAPDFAAMFKIKVQAKTVDFDEDHPTDLSKANIAISGEATLTNVLIKPKADTSTTSLTARVQGDEDEMMALSIRPSSSDKNETFNVTVGAVPAGATLTYGDYAITKGGVFEHSVVDGNVVFGNPVTDAHITVTADGDNPWKVDFVEFDNDKPMTITPPKDSNKDFTLSVSTVTVDKLVIPADPNVPGSEEKIYIDKSDPEKLTVVIAPKGVADPAEFELSANLEYTEAVAESTGINVSGLIAKAELKDDDGSETLTFKIGGLPAGFKVEGATFMGGTGTDREWSFNEATLNNVIIKAPANFNGIFDFSLYTVTTENDGDSRTEEHSVSLTITPTPEATMNLSASIDEDVSAALDFSVIHQNGDIDESISKVWIKVDSVTDGLTLILNGNPLSTKETISGAGYYVVEQGDLNKIYAQGATNWHGDTSLEVRYEVTDPGNAGLANVSTVTDSTYEITVTPVADGITLSPTASSGKEGEIIGLNLDAEMKDLYQAGDTDSSIETATLQFKGLGEFTSFYIDRVLAMNKVAYDKAAGVYTISGLSQDDIDKLGFVQAQNDIGSLQVRGQTVESANGDTSDWTHPDVGPWAAITTTITQQLSTTESDTLLWTGNAINGLGVGDTDTIQLRFGESLSSTQLASKLSNIEVLDLSIGGANSITGLTIEEVMSMTDGRNTLSIFGDAEDSVTLGSGWGAGVKGTDTTIYTASLGAETVKLEVSNLLID